MNPNLFFIEKDKKTGNNEYFFISDNAFFKEHRFRGKKKRDSLLVCINEWWNVTEISKGELLNYNFDDALGGSRRRFPRLVNL